MSLDCEPSELTPLRRSNHYRNKQQSSKQLQAAAPPSALVPTSSSSVLSNYPSQSNDFNEYMSVNNNNHQVIGGGGCDSSRGDTSEPNSQQALDPKPFMMTDRRRILVRIIIDFIILLSVGLPILALFLWGDPYKRGFFCDDESLKHPFHVSTVRSWMLYITGLILPIGLVV